MSEKENSKYIYPVEELDKIIEQINQGIQPMVSDDMMEEIRLRIKEIERKIFDDDDEEIDDADADLQRRHRAMMNAQIEKERKKASQHDVIILEISQEQKQKIREQMSVSIVRPNPEIAYNKTDDEMNIGKERREINEKLKSLKNCYYNQTDWINAVKIIMEAVEVSLGKYGDSDYPWLTYEEAKELFREHKIKLTYPIPKLYVNHSTILADKELLKGIMNGDVVLKDKKEEEERIARLNRERKKNNKLEPVQINYNIISDDEYNEMLSLHRSGYDTPLSLLISVSSRTYNPTSIPFGNRFMANNKQTNISPTFVDWSKEGAADEYFEATHGIKTDIVDIVRFLNDENGGILNNSLLTNANKFMKTLKQAVSGNNTTTCDYNYYLPNYMQQTTNVNPNINENAARIEQDLLDSIRMNNPSY